MESMLIFYCMQMGLHVDQFITFFAPLTKFMLNTFVCVCVCVCVCVGGGGGGGGGNIWMTNPYHRMITNLHGMPAISCKQGSSKIELETAEKKQLFSILIAC